MEKLAISLLKPYLLGRLSSALCLLAIATAFGSADAQVNVLTAHNDTARTGQNLNETILMPSNVTPAQFGRLFFHTISGRSYAQPLYVSQISISNTRHT